MKITNTSPKLLTLAKQTSVDSQLSDHNILLHNGILSFNMMMQGNWNAEKKRFNNGFGLIESDMAYQQRIVLIVKVLAELVYLNPAIHIVGLVEAPIKEHDILLFISECALYPSLQRFLSSITANIFTPMGVATFFDAKRVNAKLMSQHEAQSLPSLKDRVQKFEITHLKNKQTCTVYNLHLPYDLAKSKDNKSLVTFAKSLFASQSKTPTIVLGDFNIHPQTVLAHLFHVFGYIQEHNNVLSTAVAPEHGIGQTYDTVDAILHSACLVDQPINKIDARNLPNYGGNLYKEFVLLIKYMCLLQMAIQTNRKNHQHNCNGVLSKNSLLGAGFLKLKPNKKLNHAPNFAVYNSSFARFKL